MMSTASDIARHPRCIMGTVCIPWTADYHLDESLFRHAVRDLLQHGTRQLYLFGTAGEGHAVSERQFHQITRLFIEEMARFDAPPMVGVITPSLSQAIERIEWAISMDVRRFQISLPSWGACTEAETFTFFQQICERFPQSQFMHYNLKRAGRLVTAPEYARLAEAFP